MQSGQFSRTEERAGGALGRDTLIELIEKHYVHIGKIQGDRAAITYLAQGEQAKVENGDFPVVGYNPDGSIIVDESGYELDFFQVRNGG